MKNAGLVIYKFERLDVWELSLDLNDKVYGLADKLPESENYNLKSQLFRAVSSISLNIAEGSTGQSNREQARFLGFARRSLIEVIGCFRIILRRKYLKSTDRIVIEFDNLANTLFIKISSFIKVLTKN